jgi:hypothetical protein
MSHRRWWWGSVIAIAGSLSGCAGRGLAPSRCARRMAGAGSTTAKQCTYPAQPSTRSAADLPDAGWPARPCFGRARSTIGQKRRSSHRGSSLAGIIARMVAGPGIHRDRCITTTVGRKRPSVRASRVFRADPAPGVGLPRAHDGPARPPPARTGRWKWRAVSWEGAGRCQAASAARGAPWLARVGTPGSGKRRQAP